MGAFLTIFRLRLGGFPESGLAWTLFMLWCIFLIMGWRRIFSFLRCAIWEILSGWRSSVMRMKMSQLQQFAMDAGAEWRHSRPGDSELQSAFSDVILVLWEASHPVGL